VIVLPVITHSSGEAVGEPAWDSVCVQVAMLLVLIGVDSVTSVPGTASRHSLPSSPVLKHGGAASIGGGGGAVSSGTDASIGVGVLPSLVVLGAVP
jgi:hypothetical protein